MTTPRRVRDRFNPNIQWFEPPIDVDNNRVARDSLTYTDERGIGGVSTDLWGVELRLLLERLAGTRVGRTVMTFVQRRATIHPGTRCQTQPDPYADNPLDHEPGLLPEDARFQATYIGANAMIGFAPTHARYAEGAATWSPDVSLLHELVHAVTITCGIDQHGVYTREEARRRAAPSGEEEVAWVVDNMYRSERGMWLRSLYEGPLERPGSPLRGSRLRTFEAVSYWNRRLRPFAAELERIDVPYNPFRDFARLPPLARPR